MHDWCFFWLLYVSLNVFGPPFALPKVCSLCSLSIIGANTHWEQFSWNEFIDLMHSSSIHIPSLLHHDIIQNAWTRQCFHWNRFKWTLIPSLTASPNVDQFSNNVFILITRDSGVQSNTNNKLGKSKEWRMRWRLTSRSNKTRVTAFYGTN